MKYELKNDKLTIKVDTLGAELISVKGNQNGQEYLWCGDKKFWGRHSPVLFPFVGKPKDGKYRYDGKEYVMGQHGFARDMEFQCISEKDGEIWFVLNATQETKEKYPFDFRLEIGYRLEEDTIAVMWRVANQEKEKEMYFSIGAHPAFMCPVKEGEKKTDYSIYMNGKTDSIMYHFLNANSGLMRDERYRLELKEGTCRLTETFFDESAYIIEDRQVSEVSLTDPQGKAYITVSFDAPLVGIWSPEKKNAPFVCIEPWYGRCDRENFEGTLQEREWGNKLAPMEVFEAFYRIRVEQ